jgi:cell division protein FtsA
MANIITGLDIGTSSIKGVVADKKKDGTLSVISVFSHPSAGLRKGVLVDEEEALKVFRKVMVDLEKVSKKATENIFININGKHIIPRLSRGIVAVSRADQEIQQDDVDRVFQASEAIKFSQGNYTILHNVVSEYLVDDVGEITDPVGMKGSRLEVSTMLIQAFHPHIKKLVELLKKTGGDVSGIIFSPLASGRAVLSKRQKELGTVLIDFGGGTTSLVVYEEGKVVHSKSLPVGSGHVTNDIAMGLKVSIDLAEKIKKTYGYAISKDVSRKEKIDLSEIDVSVKDNTEVSSKFISEIIEIRLEEILELVNDELKEATGSVQLPAGAVICGGGVKIAGMDELIKRELKLPVQIGYPQVDGLEAINPTHKDLIEDPEFSTAVGLLIWGNEEVIQPSGPVEVVKKFLKNLMP